MKTLKPIKKMSKEGREKRVLLALVEQYILHGKPVGSASLKEADIADLSAATIRNYFARLEQEGYLLQQHTSGGRIPTDKAFRLYAEEELTARKATVFPPITTPLDENDSREIALYLQQVAEELSERSESAVFLSAPRFDQDFIIGIKLITIDHSRILAVVITDFGVIKTEIIHLDRKLSTFSMKRLEDYFSWRLTGIAPPEDLTEDEELLAKKIYNELIVRYIVGYSNFTEDDIYRTGFSKLIAYPEFHDAALLASSLSLFENRHCMRHLLKECTTRNSLKYWIGSDLAPYSQELVDCAIIAIPYHINRQAAGAIGLLSPMRVPYGKLFSLMEETSKAIGETLTRNIYKFKIQYRHPQQSPLNLNTAEPRLLNQAAPLLIEDMRITEKE